MRRTVQMQLGVLVLAGLCACNRGDPKTVKYWVAKVQDEHTEREKKADMDHLREVAKSSHEPNIAGQVCALLKDQPGDVEAAAAEVLGDLGDKSAVGPLLSAIDISRGAGDDHITEGVNHANKAIARALGELGDPKATPGLLKLLKSKDNYTVIEAIDALGKLRAKEAVKPLSDIATDSTIETFINKRAIMALGEIGDPSAIPAIHQMLYEERKGISFFAESSFALYEIGKPSTAVLLSDIEGKDPQFMSWAKDHDILKGAILAKTAQILGDLNDRSAEGELLKLLSYKDENAQLQYATRMQAADALGRMRSRAAIRPLEAMLGDEEVSARDTYWRALRFIGDKGAVEIARKKAEAKESIGYREDAYKTLALLGGPGELKAYDGLLAGEDKRLDGECKDAGIGDADCASQKKEYLGQLKLYRGALATGCAEGQEACWEQKLSDANPFVRNRAALELGRSGKADALPELISAIQRPLDGKSDEEVTNQDDARFAAIMAVHWLLDDGAKPANAAAIATKLEAQADEERKATATMRSAEDVKRLAVRLRRAS